MALPIIAGLLIGASVYLVFCQLKFANSGFQSAHLPAQALKEDLPTEAKRTGEFPLLSLEKNRFHIFDKYKEYEQKIKANTLRRRLAKAGAPMGILEFLAFQALSLVLTPVLGFIILSGAIPRKDIAFFICLAAGYLIPHMWLNKKIKKRQEAIRKDLPNVIDLLNLCVSGGLDFMLAVNRVIRDLKPCELTRELAEVYRQTQMGKTRREALKDFTWRVDIPEVHSFVRTLVQADRMGTPMSDALKVQSDEIRTRRFQYGEAMALKAPIKLLFPLFAFILPVVLIIVAGPIILQFAKGGMRLGF